MEELETAKALLGITEFRGTQEQCIDRILNEKKDIFCIMPTGTGKSACYQLPGLVLDGVTVVVSPLLALMRDQVDTLAVRGVLAASLSGRRLYAPLLLRKRLRKNKKCTEELKFIYTTPETLRVRGELFLSLKISLLVIDEAHCVSGWGMDFRPSYRALQDFTARLEAAGQWPIVAAFTATADENVVEDTLRLLDLRMEAEECVRLPEGQDGVLSPHGNVTKKVILCKNPREKQKALRSFILRHLSDKGIIFCGMKAYMEEIQAVLDQFKADGLTYGEYYGSSGQDANTRRRGLEAFRAEKARKNAMRAFRQGNARVMIATSAFGMGVNVLDVRYVVRYSFPGSMTDYTQQCGRAGRDGGKDPRSIVVNCSADLRQRIWGGELSFYEAILADGVYSLWRRGRDSFTLRELACLISGNPNFVFRDGRSGGSARKKEMKQGLENLMRGGKTETSDAPKTPAERNGEDQAGRRRMLLPIEKKTGSGRDEYLFSKSAMENLPWAFPLQNAASLENGLYPIPARCLREFRRRPETGRRGEVKDTREYTIIKFYLLHELARMKQTRTSRRIIYSRRPHRAGDKDPIGLLHVYSFFPENMTASNRRKKEKYIHETVCGILQTLIPGGFRELNAFDLRAHDPRDGDGLWVDGRQIRGVEIIADLPL